MTFVAAQQVSGIWKPVTAIPADSLGVLASPAGYTVAAPADFHAASPPAVNGSITNVFSGSKTLNADAFGLTFHRYPGGTTPEPTALFKWARSHDYAPGNKRVRWSSIEATQGSFDWSALDDFVNVHRAAGRKIIHTLYGTPAWASARPGEASSYGPGVAAEPANLAHWDAYCAACATRYAGRIDYYEVWNEPNLSGFYSGTQTILSQMVRRANQSIKAIDAAAKIVSPAVTSLQTGNGQTYFAAMMAASDGASGNMSNWTDAVGVHLYPNNVAGITSMPAMLATFSGSLAGLGLGGKPVINSEFGVLSPPLQVHDAPVRASLLARMLLLSSVCSGGCLASIWYDGDPDSNFGLTALDWGQWNAIIDVLTRGPITVINVLRDGRLAAVIGGINYLF